MKQISPRADGLRLRGARPSVYIRKIDQNSECCVNRRAPPPRGEFFWPGRPNRLEGEMIIGPKRPRRELTFARLSAIENGCKCFLEVAAPHRAVQVGFMVERREVLKWVLCGIAAPLGAGAGGIAGTPCAAQEIAPPEPLRSFALGDPAPFDPSMVTEAARTLSKRPFRAARRPIFPACSATLAMSNTRQFVSAQGPRFGPPKIPAFAIEPLHRGFIFSSPMEISLVDGRQSSPHPL